MNYIQDKPPHENSAPKPAEAKLTFVQTDYILMQVAHIVIFYYEEYFQYIILSGALPPNLEIYRSVEMNSALYYL